MTATEMQLRKEKDLCYNCDEKFGFNHRYPNLNLMVLQSEEDHDTHLEPEPLDDP